MHRKADRAAGESRDPALTTDVGITTTMASNDTTPENSGDNPISPLPHALAIDEAIERRLEAFDFVPREIRDAAWAIAASVQRLSATGALAVVAFVARVAEAELLSRDTPLQ